MLAVNEQGNNAAPYTYAHASIQFRCLAQGDAGLQRPTMRPMPTQVIGVEVTH